MCRLDSVLAILANGREKNQITIFEKILKEKNISENTLLIEKLAKNISDSYSNQYGYDGIVLTENFAAVFIDDYLK